MRKMHLDLLCYKQAGMKSLGLKLLMFGVGGIGLGLFSGCSSSKQTSESKILVHSAPLSEENLGVLVSSSVLQDQDMKNFVDSKNGKLRILKKDSLYEVYGVDPSEIEELKNVDAGLIFQKNELINVSDELSSKQDTKTCKSTSESPKLALHWAGENPQFQNNPWAFMFASAWQTQIEDLKKYEKIAKIYDLKTVDDRKIIKWEIEGIGPEGSSWDQKSLFRTGMKTADELKNEVQWNEVPEGGGLYSVRLTVWDEQGNCGWDQVSVAVTENQKLNQENQKKKNLSIEELEKKFPHLFSIQAPGSWYLSEGEYVTIAVVDTGVNYNLSDFSGKVSINSKEIPGNGIDDDKNGKIDDAYGWDFIHDDPYAFDDRGHGTHVAGLSSSSVMGVAPKSKILPIKVLSAWGKGDLGSIAAGIEYAVDQGADIINLSLGGGGSESMQSILKKSIEYAEQKGVLVVAAAGNSSENIDEKPMYPASFSTSTLIKVASVKQKDFSLTSYSSYGQMLVDLAAPGGDESDADSGINSLHYFYPRSNLQYVSKRGTSMATPLVSGAAALVWARHPELTASQVIDQILSYSRPVQALQDKVLSSAVLQCYPSVKFSNR